ncbi:hypothetical protein EHM69_04945 [candidate division KSB1 bacterium]|nr:MAG: hypothetical protein EHM69_04945 [candidate division KSB1 bacterium]
MAWPTPNDYSEAIQNVKTAFSDCELQTAKIEWFRPGMPKCATGNFAIVFPMATATRQIALRCFTTPQDDRYRRYEVIQSELNRANLPCMVGFDFLRQGIRIKGSWYPVLKMDWVKGTSIDKYVNRNKLNTQVIRSLIGRITEMLGQLKEHQFAHGDLQHGNILVCDDGTLRLVDYDAMYVPGLHGLRSNEIGHPNYQHPKRCASDFGPDLDNFSAWVILTSLISLSVAPNLWDALGAGDDCMLFRRKDFMDPFAPVFDSLDEVQDAQGNSIGALFKAVLSKSSVTDIPVPDLSLFDQTWRYIAVPIPANLDAEFESIKKLIDATSNTSLEPVSQPWYIGHLPEKVPKSFDPAPPSLVHALQGVVIGIIVIITVCIVFGFPAFIPTSIGAIIIVFAVTLLRKSYTKNEAVITRNRLHMEVRQLKDKMKQILGQRKFWETTLRTYKEEHESAQAQIIDRERIEKLTVEDLKKKADALYQQRTREIKTKLESLETTQQRELLNHLAAQSTVFMNQELSNTPITLASGRYLSPHFVTVLQTNGFRTAYDIMNVRPYHGDGYIQDRNGRWVHVTSIGPARCAQLQQWWENVVSEAKARAPRQLNRTDEIAIREKHESTIVAVRGDLTKLEGAAQREALALTERLSTARSKAKVEREQVLKRAAKRLSEQREEIEVAATAVQDCQHAIARLRREIELYAHHKFSLYLKMVVNQAFTRA